MVNYTSKLYIKANILIINFALFSNYFGEYIYMYYKPFFGCDLFDPILVDYKLEQNYFFMFKNVLCTNVKVSKIMI